MRTRALLLLATTLTGVTIAGLGLAAGGAASPERAPGAATAPATLPVVRAARVLGAWDHARAAAWAHGDPAALAALYTPSSVTGARDVADLRRWRDRGLRIVGLRQQVMRLRVLVDTRRTLVLAATDRTVDAIAVGRHRRTALPLSAWAVHRIRLRHQRGRWLVDEVAARRW
jgi:hypothetical protein